MYRKKKWHSTTDSVSMTPVLRTVWQHQHHRQHQHNSWLLGVNSYTGKLIFFFHSNWFFFALHKINLTLTWFVRQMLLSLLFFCFDLLVVYKENPWISWKMDPSFIAEANSTTYDLSLLNNRWQTLLIVLYSGTAILSFTSNVLAIFILFSPDRINSELWKYLVNLSIADILMALFSIPFTYTSFMLGQWIFPNWMCPFVQSVQLCSVFVSVYTLTVIGFDRYVLMINLFPKKQNLKIIKLKKKYIILVKCGKALQIN